MNIFQKIKAIFGVDYVYLIFHDGKHKARSVQWYQERAYSAPYLLETTCQLLPNGETKGPIYIDGWLPITDNMEVFFKN